MFHLFSVNYHQKQFLLLILWKPRLLLFFPQDFLIRNNADLQGLKSDVMLGGLCGFSHSRGGRQVKSSHLYLYSAFNNTNCDKATAQYQNGKIVSIM